MKPLVGIVAHQALVSDGELSTRHEVVSVPYVKALRKAGGVPVLLPLIDPDDATEALQRVDAIVLTGGADIDPSNYGAEADPLTVEVDPARDARDLAIARLAVDRDVPVLAICRGCQVLNVALGGTLHQHVDDHFDVPRYNEYVHDVEVDGGSVLGAWLQRDRLGVNTLHHQAVATTGPGVKVVAHATDGTIEGIESGRAVGVQWHPEMLRHLPEHLALFEALVRAGAG